MKRTTKLFVIAGMLMLAANALFANSIDYLTPQSARYFMNQARQAATDAADAVSFNPAGAALMAPGWYFNVSNVTFFMDYRESLPRFL